MNQADPGGNATAYNSDGTRTYWDPDSPEHAAIVAGGPDGARYMLDRTREFNKWRVDFVSSNPGSHTFRFGDDGIAGGLKSWEYAPAVVSKNMRWLLRLTNAAAQRCTGLCSRALNRVDHFMTNSGYYFSRLFSRSPTASQIAVKPNEFHHIFGDSKHKLGALLRAFNGDPFAAYNAVQRAAQARLNSGMLAVTGRGGVMPTPGSVVAVRGVPVQLAGGRVMQGNVRSGSFSSVLRIPK